MSSLKPSGLVAAWAVATKPLLSLWSQGVWAWWGTKSRPWTLQEETSCCLRSWWRRSPLKLKSRRADQSWQLFKAPFPTVQELSILVCRKLSKAGQARLGKDLLLKLGSKKEVHRQWKWGQVTWGKYRDMVLICRGRVRKAKAKLKQDLARDTKNHKKGFYKYIGQKRNCKENATPLPIDNQEEWTGGDWYGEGWVVFLSLCRQSGSPFCQDWSSEWVGKVKEIPPPIREE